MSKNKFNLLTSHSDDHEARLNGLIELANKIHEESHGVTVHETVVEMEKWGIIPKYIPKYFPKWIPPVEKPVALELPPCYRTNELLRFLYRKNTYERVFAEQFADMEIEYIEAIDAEDERLAKWVKIRGHLFICATVIVHACSCTIGKFLRSIFRIT